ncbi:MAG TPA: hypothetical protein VFH27_02955 [Longimicrobiaceae bacterium]|nr:hypothetical protein [Longimicrobiaceae bacterium]
MHSHPPHALVSSEVHKFDVTLDGTNGLPAVRHVRAARLTPDGRQVVVLGSESPFIHVLGVEGRAARSFGTVGEHSGGLRYPVTIAVSDAEELLVAEASGAALVFDLDGSVHADIADTGVLPMAAAAPCAGEWLIYGPRKDAEAGSPTEWLHGLPNVGAGQLSPHGLLSRAPAGTVGLARPFGIVARGGGAVLRHDDGDAPAVVTWACGEESASISPRPGDGHRSIVAPPVSSGGIALRAPHGRAAPSGLAAIGDAVAIADLSFGDQMETEFTLLSEGRERHIRITGGYVLRDSRPGVGVLIEEVGPAPHLFILGEADFLGLFD